MDGPIFLGSRPLPEQLPKTPLPPDPSPPSQRGALFLQTQLSGVRQRLACGCHRIAIALQLNCVFAARTQHPSVRAGPQAGA